MKIFLKYFYKSIKIILGIYLFFVIATYIFLHFVFKNDNLMDQERNFQYHVRVLLGIPYYKKEGVDWAIQNHPDLEPISKEEWLSFAEDIEPFHIWSPLDKTRTFDVYYKMPKEMQHKINYLEPVMFLYANGGISNHLCNNYYSCKSHNLLLEDYVLKNPKVLNNLIKILERPSKFIKKLKNAKNQAQRNQIINALEAMNCIPKNPDYMYEFTKFWQSKKIFTSLEIKISEKGQNFYAQRGNRALENRDKRISIIVKQQDHHNIFNKASFIYILYSTMSFFVDALLFIYYTALCLFL
ncbi:MAG: hypothetical protein ISN64_00290 [Rickettsia sp.]|nr:hypothetical protein [Rickettsia sp.]